MKGMIFHIQRHSIHDGPGIRTTVFFKGCNLSCTWCHNPESIPHERDLEFHVSQCIGCGRCRVACSSGAQQMDVNGRHFIDRRHCTRCMRCTYDCFAEALVEVGREMTAVDLVRAILTDQPYYQQSGGGVTFSGGECMLQVEFLSSVLKLCRKERIHTAVDTAGCVSWSSFERILDDTDLFLYDLKAADPVLHHRLTGADNALIIGNLDRLCASGKRIFVRIPFVPGANDEDMDSMAGILAGRPIERVDIIPYHPMAKTKYESLGKAGSMHHFMAPKDSRIQGIVDRMRAQGIHAFSS